MLNSLEIATQGLLFGAGDIRAALRSLDTASEGLIQLGGLETGVSEERTFTPVDDTDLAFTPSGPGGAFMPTPEGAFVPLSEAVDCVPGAQEPFEAIRQKAVSMGAQEALRAISDKKAWKPKYQPGKAPGSQGSAKVKK